MDNPKDKTSLPLLGTAATEQFSAQAILDFLAGQDIIKMDDVLEEMEKKQKEAILEKVHPFKIYQEKGGRWCTYITDESKPNKRKRIAKKSKAALEEFLLDFYGIEDEADKKKNCTLKMLYPEWLEYKRLHTTAETYITRIDTDWKTYYAGTDIINVPIRKLDKISLDKWAHTLIREYSMTKNQYYNVTVIMRQALLYAVDLGIIEKSPFSEVHIDGKRLFRKVLKKPDSVQVFSKEETREITSMAWEDFHNGVKTTYPLAPLALLFQLQTGVRIGELCALKLSDIETENSIHIQRMIRRDEKEVVPHTKTDCGDRQVLLTSVAKELIQTARDYQKRLHIDTEYIFSVNDRPIPERSVSTLYTKYTKYTETGIHKSSHASRRTFISSLLDEQMSINSVRQYAGHSDERTTLKNYAFDRSSEAEKLKKFENALT